MSKAKAIENIVRFEELIRGHLTDPKLEQFLKQQVLELRIKWNIGVELVSTPYDLEGQMEEEASKTLPKPVYTVGKSDKYKMLKNEVVS